MAAPTETAGTPDAVAEAIASLVAESGITGSRDLFVRSLRALVAQASESRADRLEWKITASAIDEMRRAFAVFAPYRDVPKVTMFGSARTQPDAPLYAQAKALASRLADAGWMVVTGAGPGIMAAGMEGAGRERSIGVNIRLPFEQGANAWIAGDPKLVEMKYFFTRKLMLIKESDAYVSLPGGFGTLDETFELLTLLQTGKARPAPVVLLDVPGGGYFESLARFIDDAVIGHGMATADDKRFYAVTDDVDAAEREITGFYRNHRSIRWVGGRLVLRMKQAPTAAELAELSAEFGAISPTGDLDPQVVGPSADERATNDDLEAARISVRFDQISNAGLRMLIDRLNQLPSLGDVEAAPPDRSAEGDEGSLDLGEAAVPPPAAG